MLNRGVELDDGAVLACHAETRYTLAPVTIKSHMGMPFNPEIPGRKLEKGWPM